MSKSFLEELPNINYFISKLILTKSIPTKLILSRINFITKHTTNLLFQSDKSSFMVSLGKRHW